jgi:hypothetical protein
MDVPDATEEPLAWFCAELAQLRADAGGPTLRELSTIRGVPSVPQLSDIFNGKIKKAPDRDLVQAVVAACLAHGRDRLLRGPRDIGYWLARYDDLTLKLVRRRLARPGGRSSDHTCRDCRGLEPVCARCPPPDHGGRC